MLQDHYFSVSSHAYPHHPFQLVWTWFVSCFLERQLTEDGDRFAILVGGTTDGLYCGRDRDGGSCDAGVERVVGVGR